MRCNDCDFRTDDEELMEDHEGESGHQAEDLSPEWTI